MLVKVMVKQEEKKVKVVSLNAFIIKLIDIFMLDWTRINSSVIFFKLYFMLEKVIFS